MMPRFANSGGRITDHAIMSIKHGDLFDLRASIHVHLHIHVHIHVSPFLAQTHEPVKPKSESCSTARRKSTTTTSIGTLPPAPAPAPATVPTSTPVCARTTTPVCVCKLCNIISAPSHPPWFPSHILTHHQHTRPARSRGPRSWIPFYSRPATRPTCFDEG